MVRGQHGDGQSQPEGTLSGVHRGHQGAQAQVGAGVQAPRDLPVRGHPRSYLEARSGFAGTLRRPYAVGRLRPPSRFYEGPSRGGLCPSLRSLPPPARRGNRPFGGAGRLGGAQRRHHRGSAAGFHRLLRPRAGHEGSQGGVLHPPDEPEPAQAVCQRRPLPAHTSLCHHTGVRQATSYGRRSTGRAIRIVKRCQQTSFVHAAPPGAPRPSCCSLPSGVHLGAVRAAGAVIGRLPPLSYVATGGLGL